MRVCDALLVVLHFVIEPLWDQLCWISLAVPKLNLYVHDVLRTLFAFRLQQHAMLNIEKNIKMFEVKGIV